MYDSDYVSRLEDSMETIAFKLDCLASTIHTISLGLQKENMEQQAIDCVNCIGVYVGSIKGLVDKNIHHTEEMHGTIKT